MDILWLKAGLLSHVNCAIDGELEIAHDPKPMEICRRRDNLAAYEMLTAALMKGQPLLSASRKRHTQAVMKLNAKRQKLRFNISTIRSGCRLWKVVVGKKKSTFQQQMLTVELWKLIAEARLLKLLIYKVVDFNSKRFRHFIEGLIFQHFRRPFVETADL